jgi:hypothetical protein
MTFPAKNADKSEELLVKLMGELSQEEIDTIIVKRLSEFKFSDYYMKSVDDRYLTNEQLNQKNQFLESERVKEKEKLKKQILEAQEKLSKLQFAETCL